MERRGSRSSKTTGGGRRNTAEQHVSQPSEWKPTSHRDRPQTDATTNSTNSGRRISRTAPSSPEPRHKFEVTTRSHSSERHSPRHSEESHSRQQLEERQLAVYQKALKEQIVQSDHLIKAIYRFSDCIDMTEKAMRNLHDVMGDYWEDDWPSAERYYVTLQDQEQLWDNYEQSMRKLLDPIREYEGQFEGAEDKIEEFQDVRRQYRQACASLEALRRRRAAGHDITFAESDRDRLSQRYDELVSYLGHGLPKIIASRIPFMEKLFYQLSNNLLQFCLETCKVQSQSSRILSKLRSYDLSVTLGEGRGRTTIRAPARKTDGVPRGHSVPADRSRKSGRSAGRQNSPRS